MYAETPYLRRRSRLLFVSGFVVISLMLTILGLVATGSVLAPAILANLRATIPVRVFLHDGIGDLPRIDLETRLRDEFPSVRKVVFVPKDSAAHQWYLQTGEDVTKLNNGINPLPASLDVYLWPDSSHRSALAHLQTAMKQEITVAETAYPAEMLVKAGENLQKLTPLAAIFILLVVLIVTYVVFATIRISIYADRMAIRSMQLIGASPGFIRRPYLVRGLTQGVGGALLACLVVMLVLALARQQFPSLAQPYQLSSGGFVVALGGIALFGALVGATGSALAVNRYLHRSLDAIA